MCQSLFCCCVLAPSSESLSKLKIGDAMVLITGALSMVGGMVAMANEPFCRIGNPDVCSFSEFSLGVGGFTAGLAGIIIAYGAGFAIERLTKSCCQDDSQMDKLAGTQETPTNYTSI